MIQSRYLSGKDYEVNIQGDMEQIAYEFLAILRQADKSTKIKNSSDSWDFTS